MHRPTASLILALALAAGAASAASAAVHHRHHRARHAAPIIPVPPGATAIEARFSPAYRACARAAKAEQAMKRCNATEIRFQKVALEREYKAALAAAGDPVRQGALQQEQVSWDGRLKAKCPKSGEDAVADLAAELCVRDEIVQRRIDLQAMPTTVAAATPTKP